MQVQPKLVPSVSPQLSLHIHVSVHTCIQQELGWSLETNKTSFSQQQARMGAS